MLDILRDLSRPILDPFGLSASSNPTLQLIGDPLGIYPDQGGDGKGGLFGKGDDEDSDDDSWDSGDQKKAHRANVQNRLASGNVNYTEAPYRAHNSFPYTKQIAQANALRGVY